MWDKLAVELKDVKTEDLMALPMVVSSVDSIVGRRVLKKVV